MKSAPALLFDRARAAAAIPDRSSQWFECARLPDGSTYLRWAQLCEFLIAPDARTIHYHPLEKATDEALGVYLLGQVLSFSLLSLGYEPLHATGVVIDGSAIAIVGDCGYGKSTLGAAFLARGFPILTDDVLAVRFHGGHCTAHAGPPRLKLFPSVARSLLGRRGVHRLNPGTRKLILPLATRQSARDAVPLSAIYVLRDPAVGRRTSRVRLTALHGQRAFVEVIRSAFNLIQVDEARLRNQFSMATRLVKTVPVRRLTYPRRLARLDAVCDAVLADRRAGPAQ